MVIYGTGIATIFVRFFPSQFLDLAVLVPVSVLILWFFMIILLSYYDPFKTLII